MQRRATDAASWNFWSRVRSSTPAAIGLALTLATFLALTLLGMFAHSEIQRAERMRLGVWAQVLDEHVLRSVAAADKAMVALANGVTDLDSFGSTPGANRALTWVATAHAAIAAVQWVDSTGVVLASSAPALVGSRLSLAQLGLLPPPGQHRLGAVVEVKAWSGGASAAMAMTLGAAQFLPVVRTVRLEGERLGYLLALLKPHDLLPPVGELFGASQAVAYLFNEAADLLARSGALDATVGQAPLLPAAEVKVATQSLLKRYAPTVRAASLATASRLGGAVDQAHTVAFRRLIELGLVVWVEQPASMAWRTWYGVMQRYFVIGMVALLAIALTCLPAHQAQRRSIRARGRLRRARASVFRDGQERIFRTDKQGRTTPVNRVWRNAFNPVLDVPVGTPLADLAAPEYHALVQGLFDGQSSTKIRTALAEMNLMGDTARHFNLVVIPWKDSNGVEGFLGSAVDMTERFGAEDALQRQLSLVALILEMSPWPVSTFDAKGRYLSVNKAWEDFMGLSRNQILGTVSAGFMGSDDFALHKAQDVALARDGGRVRYEAKVTHRDGSRRDVIVTKVLLPTDSGQAPGWLSATLDVSEFRNAERATLEAISEAEEASRAKSEFTANVSHELRTPLQSILGFSELGAMRAQRTPQLQQMFEQIHVSGGRMLALVNNLLDLSKIESAVGPMSLTRADLRELIPPVVRELRPLLDAKDLEIEVVLGQDNLIAKIDPDRFQQVIRNVLANAIKFSPMQGRIAFHAQIQGERDIAITVRDHGAGIPPTELDTIFGAFVQSTRTKNNSGGTGLGLAICRKIIDFHGGSIHAANCPDGGAIFTVVLPLRHYLNRDSAFETGYGSIY